MPTSRFIGRNGGIRTHDPLTPSQVRYQAALHSVIYTKPLACIGVAKRSDYTAALQGGQQPRDRKMPFLKELCAKHADRVKPTTSDREYRSVHQ